MRSSNNVTLTFSFFAAAAPLPPGRPSIASSAAFTPFHTVTSGIGSSALTSLSVSGPWPFSSPSISASFTVDGSHFGAGARDAPSCAANRVAANPGSGPPYSAPSSSSHASE